jgi:glutamyl-tRNA reductase
LNPDSPLELIVLGLSHHTAPVELRERLSVPEAEWNNASALFCGYESISEAAVLSTCNRFEVYMSGPNRYACIRDGMRIFEQRAGSDIDIQTLRSSVFVLSGDDALWHLFNVAAGLDSIVLGEGQILAQVKKAYEHGVEPSTGRAGKVVSRMLNSAITAGKRVRTETGIAKGAVSISSAAAEFTSGVLSGELPDLVQGDAQSQSVSSSSCSSSSSAPPLTMDKARITILGAGKMSRLLLIHLESHGIRNVTIVNRSPERMQELQAEFPNLCIELRSMEELYDTLRESDIVYPSTAAPNYLIEPEALRAALATRTRPHRIQIVDISVPRNVHPDCASVPGVALYNVDHLKLVVDRNSARRQEEIAKAEGILREELDKYRQWQQSLNAVPTIAKLHERGEALRQEEVQKLVNKFVDLSDHNKELVDRLSKGIVAKLLHGPVQHLRQQSDVDAARAAIAQVRDAFQLHHHQQHQQQQSTPNSNSLPNYPPVASR